MSTTAKLYLPPPALSEGAHVAGRAAYDALVQEAAADHQAYWARLAREFVEWKRPFHQVLNASDAPFFKWFEDGTLNASYNCLDRQVHAGLGAKTAIIFTLQAINAIAEKTAVTMVSTSAASCGLASKSRQAEKSRPASIPLTCSR